jgi:hypothetical protein
MENVPEIITEGNGTERSRIKRGGGYDHATAWDVGDGDARGGERLLGGPRELQHVPEAVMESGPRMPAARSAADTRGATR